MARNKFDVDESLETKFNMKHLKRSFIYVKKQKKPMIISLLLSIGAVILSLFVPVLVQRAMDFSIPNKNIKEIILLSIIMLISIIISVVLGVIKGYIMTKVGQNIIFDIRQDLFAHLQKLPFSYYDDRPHGKILVRVVSYVNNVSDMLSNGIINLILELFNLVFICIFMFFVNVQLSLVIIAGLPILVTIFMLLKPAQRKSWQKYSNKSSNLNAYIHESIMGVKINQIFDREEENKEIFKELCLESRSSWFRAIFTANLVWYSVENISALVFSFVYITGVVWIGGLQSGITVGVLVAMTSYASRFWQPIANMSNLYNSFLTGIAYLERIFETMDEPVKITESEGAIELPPIIGDVTFNNVVFEYELGRPILNNISFDIKAGESIALVGPTGAGKTTIVNLLSRFYDIKSGDILIDGKSIYDVTINSLRSQMGIMLQDSFIFSGTILDNIKYGKIDATLEQVIGASKIANSHDFISKMEKGYDTEVLERGSRLSQGQSQLVCFARTIVSDPKILVLDEATSSIDTKTEKILQEALQKMLVGRTSFIIAHRLSTIKSCDKIMYISAGVVTECGSHIELMEKKGEYFKLYTSQLFD